MYIMSHKPSKSFSTLLGNLSGAGNEDFGAIHGDDLLFLFNDVLAIEDALQTEEDKQTRERMVTLWTNFAKYADPTPFQEDDLTVWKPFTKNVENYLNITAEPRNVEGEVLPTRMFFVERIYWEDVEDEVGNQVNNFSTFRD
jgi:carboxylesterase type B